MKLVHPQMVGNDRCSKLCVLSLDQGCPGKKTGKTLNRSVQGNFVTPGKKFDAVKKPAFIIKRGGWRGR